MNIYALISLAAFMLCFFFGNFIYHKNPKSQLNKMVAILCVLVAFLAFVEFGYRQAQDFDTAFYWLKLSTLWPFVPSVLLHIALIFTKKTKLLTNKLTYILIYSPAFIISGLALTTNLLLDGALREYWGWTYAFPQNPLLFNLMAVWSVIGGSSAAILCLSYYLKATNIKRKQAKYVLAGLYMPLVISFLSDFILPNASIRVPEMTMTMSTVGIAFISYGIWKYRFPALTTAIAADEIVSTMSNFLLLLDHKMNIATVNQATLTLLGYEKNEMVGKSVKMIFAEKKDIEDLFNEENQYLRETSAINNVEATLKRKDGRIVPIFLSTSIIQNEDAKILGTVCIGSDITDLKKAEKRIKSSLEEKELLLREIHHRVKNNLQVISSMLNLQSRYIKDKSDLELFRGSQSRIKTMAMIHEHLYRSADFAHIDFSEYIHSLVNYLLRYYNADPNVIKLKLDVEEDISLNIDTAVPCGLIINELVSNALKFAFRNGRPGEVKIDFHSVDDNFILTVSDNGMGFPEDLDYSNVKTLGLQLVDSLVRQLGGAIELDRSQGTKFTIIFKETDYQRRI
ncbi:MAG: PAS domain S-box protein [Euryarchaeota archaeon]|nr:PAS domain S-box protein [Euryarchaeota archaeon]